MASDFEATFGQRGLVQLQIVETDVTGDGKVDSRDARAWAYEIDHDEEGPYTPPLSAIVIADTDGGLWDLYKADCGSDTFCQQWCHALPQFQILDRGTVTVDDICVPSSCGQCGYDVGHLWWFLDVLLPPKGCGEAVE